MSRLLAALLALSLSACATITSQGQLSASDSTTLDAFRQRLASQDSATAALESWCSDWHLAAPPTIRAQLVDREYDGTIPIELPAAMGSEDGDGAHGYRHVKLRCGKRVLSEAFLFYNPRRLTDEMNSALDETDTPFGKVTAPLRFRRERISENGVERGHCPAATILSHAAVLRLPDGHALAYVIECYSRANLRGRS